MFLVSQSYPTLGDPTDSSLPGSSVHGDSPGKNTRVGCHDFLQGIFPTQGSNPGHLYYRRIFYPLRHQGSPNTRILRWTLSDAVSFGTNIQILSLTYTQHTHTHTHIHVNHMYLPISTKILSPLGDITLILWKATKPLMLNCKFSKAIKEGRIGTKFQQVPQGNSKSGFQRFFLEIAFAVRVFINTLLRCRKSFTEKTWIYLQIHVLKGFHYSTWSSLYKKKNT